MTNSACPGPGGCRCADAGRSAPGRASFPTPMAIGEGLMRRQWQVRRRMRPAADGARRWDRAYLLILGWGTAIAAPPAPSTLARPDRRADPRRRDLGPRHP